MTTDVDNWVEVQDATELPKGEWLVKLEQPASSGSIYAVATVQPISNGYMRSVGGLFHFDQQRVVAYRSIPE